MEEKGDFNPKDRQRFPNMIEKNLDPVNTTSLHENPKLVPGFRVERFAKLLPPPLCKRKAKRF